jgi:hypothetical protein
LEEAFHPPESQTKDERPRRFPLKRRAFMDRN